MTQTAGDVRQSQTAISGTPSAACCATTCHAVGRSCRLPCLRTGACATQRYAGRSLLKDMIYGAFMYRYATLETLRAQFTRPQGSLKDGFADAVASDASSLVDSTAATTGD